MKSNNHNLLLLPLALTTLAVGLSLGQPAPAAGWVNTGSLSNGRDAHAAILLANGQVLVAGG